MVYAYPPARAKMAQNDGGAAAMKRRSTVIGKDFVFDPEKRAKILGINAAMADESSFGSDASSIDEDLIVKE